MMLYLKAFFGSLHVKVEYNPIRIYGLNNPPFERRSVSEKLLANYGMCTPWLKFFDCSK